MKFKLKYAMLGLALAVAGCAAYFSVWGLSQLFAGASVSVIIMASVLELGKLVTTTALHTYWNKLAKTLRIYLAISVVILMVITSAGIYGFLSNAYQSTANKLEIHEGELGVLDAKKATFEKSVVDNQKLIDTKTKRLDQLSNLRSSQESRLDNSGSNRAKNSVRGDIKSADSEIQKLNTEIDVLNAKNIVLSDSINAYNVKAIELKSGSSVAAEVGPLKYIAQLTGISMASVVNYLILLLIFVFDPLAVALVLITNKVFQIEKEEEEEEEEEEDETKKILEDIVEVLNNEDEKNVEVQNEPNYNKFEYKSPGVSTREYDNDVLEEPIEFSDDETIEQPIFENIIDPVDEIIIDGEAGEIKFPEKPLEINQEVFLPSPQEEDEQDEEEYDESHALDMVMNHILGDYEEVVEVENEVAKVEEEVAVVEEEILPVEEENLTAKGKITLEEIKEVKERNRGFSVNIPEPKRNNLIQRITGKR
jgi:hypothetical protein